MPSYSKKEGCNSREKPKSFSKGKKARRNLKSSNKSQNG
jgi:hypothetical protein